MRRNLPNLVTLTRFGFGAAMIVVAVTGGTRGWFAGWLAAAFVSDALDGLLARVLKAETEFGRKLDSWADYVVMIVAVFGLWSLWPEYVYREAAWLVTGFVAFFAVVVYGLVRWRRILAYHTWASKTLAVGLALALAALLMGWSAVPLHVVVVLQVLAATEELAIAVVRPGFSGTMPSLWHALRQRADAPKKSHGDASGLVRT
jgi:phosphatidylglycerophosphate synthase